MRHGHGDATVRADEYRIEVPSLRALAEPGAGREHLQQERQPKHLIELVRCSPGDIEPEDQERAAAHEQRTRGLKHDPEEVERLRMHHRSLTSTSSPRTESRKQARSVAPTIRRAGGLRSTRASSSARRLLFVSRPPVRRPP